MKERAHTKKKILPEVHVEMIKEKEDGIVGMEDFDNSEEREGEMGDERKNGRSDNGGYNKDMPPFDDVCPICFDSFAFPCRSNCGHWFCASCILQFWMFSSSNRPCECPLCCCRIVNLKVQTSQLIQQADDSAEVLQKVHQYNSLYVSGVYGTLHRVRALPLYMGRIFRVLMDPHRLRCIYYAMRILGLFLALLYERGEFEFIPTGGLGIKKMFDFGATILSLTLFLAGTLCRCVLSLQRWDNL